MNLFSIPIADWMALVFFVLCWGGYAWFSQWKARHQPSLMSVLHVYRSRWMREMARRENRIVDTAALANLLQPATFFASTTILILGGTLALLAAPDQIIGIVSDLPFASRSVARLLWELKILLLVTIFGYAFFKFTWAMRQYSTCTVLVVSAPPRDVDHLEYAEHLRAAANIASLAGENFNLGQRAYYYALAAVGWFLNPWALIITASVVTWVLYRREFHSPMLQELVNPTAPRDRDSAK